MWKAVPFCMCSSCALSMHGSKLHYCAKHVASMESPVGDIVCFCIVCLWKIHVEDIDRGKYSVRWCCSAALVSHKTTQYQKQSSKLDITFTGSLKAITTQDKLLSSTQLFFNTVLVFHSIYSTFSLCLLNIVLHVLLIIICFCILVCF